MIRLPNVFTILPGVPFARTLAESLWDEYRSDLLALSDVQIFLPNRRSILAMTDAFLEVSEGQAALLPQLQPIGDIDEDDLFALDPFLDSDPTILPAISPLERQMILIRLVQQSGKANSAGHASELATHLARLIDAAHTEGVDLKKIDTLVPGDLAIHWQVTRDFLSIITENWPQILAARGQCDPAQRRNLLLRKKAKTLLEMQPKTRMIAAGSTGSIPATAEFLNAIARMENGCVILPGLDPTIDDKTWQHIDLQHPYFFMKRLLEMFTIAPSQVKPWPQRNPAHQTQCDLQGLVLSALQPKEIFDLSNIKGDPTCLKNHNFVHADDPLQEARMIAIMLREVLIEPDRTAMVVTPDRVLAKAITSEMQRWEVTVNDVGGETLDKTPTGIFLRQIIDFQSSATLATAALALLRNFFTRFEHDNESHALAEIERQLRRDILPPGGLRVLAEQYDLPVLLWFLDSVTLPRHDGFTLKDWLIWHSQAAEKLGAAGEEKSPLWSHEDGEAAAQLFHTLLHTEQASTLRLTLQDYEQMLIGWMRQVTIRPRFGIHPRLRILPPIEARLQYAHVVILAGLNEGVWPMQPEANPWLSRPMQHEMGFLDAERHIGQATLDFLILFCAPCVHVTWSKQRDGVLAHPSRWVQQLSAVMKKTGQSMQPDKSKFYHWTKAWDRPDRVKPQTAPAPAPPIETRPTEFWVTDIEKWQKDPYAFYAKRILDLRPQPLLDRTIDNREWGSLSHKVLEQFFQQKVFNLPQPQLVYDTLATAAVKKYNLDPSQAMHWQNRLTLIGTWLLQHLTGNPYQDYRTEFTFTYNFTHQGKNFTLSGRTDRVDITADGLILTDYKTGKPPTWRSVQNGKSPQLPLLGLMAQKGENAILQNVAALTYVHLQGKIDRVAEVKDLKDPQHLIELNEQHLLNLLDKYYAQSAPYTPKTLALRDHDDYAHLKRTGEWASLSDEVDDDGFDFEEEDAE